MQEAQEMHIWSLGQEDPREEEMTTQASILAGKIPWTEKPCGYSPWDLKEWDTTEHACIPCFISERRQPPCVRLILFSGVPGWS